MEYKFKIIFLLGSFLLIFISCNEKSVPQMESIVQLPDEFRDFSKKFHSDSLFQIKHIVFPLSGKKNESGENDYWIPENWVMHKDFDTQSSIYKREYEIFNGMVIEKIHGNTGAFAMERRFAKVLGQWNLIYYNVVYKYPDLEMDPGE